MTYPAEWMADPSGDAGTATFMVDGDKYEMRLASFADFTQIQTMLGAAFVSGKTWAADSMQYAMRLHLFNHVKNIAPSVRMEKP